jgi:hypothetical protein
MHRVQIDLVQFVRREEIGLAGEDGFRVSGSSPWRAFGS